MTHPIYPCLWFDGNAAEAAEFYCTVFSDSKITTDTPVVVNFELSGQKFMGLNGGPQFRPNPSISFFVVCEDEREVDQAWKKLLEGGEVLIPLDKYEWSEKYGWVQDRYGVNWQLSLGKLADVGQKFTPSLMFTGGNAGKAEEAIAYYTSVFKGSSVTGILKYTEQDPDATGTVKHAQFKLGNGVFMAMDSSLDHPFNFTEGVSLVVACKDQAEIDYYWNTLTEKGEESMCGWLRDQYGVSWQIIPDNIEMLMSDPKKAKPVMDEVLKMRKIEVKKLIEAYER